MFTQKYIHVNYPTSKCLICNLPPYHILYALPNLTPARITYSTIFNYSLSTTSRLHSLHPMHIVTIPLPHHCGSCDKPKVLQSFETTGTIHPLTKNNMPEDLNLLQNCYEHFAYSNHQVRNLLSFMLTTLKFNTTISFVSKTAVTVLSGVEVL
jgi:hypothetical protein